MSKAIRLPSVAEPIVFDDLSGGPDVEKTPGSRTSLLEARPELVCDLNPGRSRVRQDCSKSR